MSEQVRNLSIQMRRIVEPIQALGVSMPANIQGAIDVAFLLSSRLKEQSKPLPDLPAALRAATTPVSRSGLLDRHIEALQKRALQGEVAKELKRSVDQAHAHAATLIKKASEVELVDLMKPKFAQAVKKSDVALIDHIEALATCLMRGPHRNEREKYAFLLRWTPGSLNDELISRYKGDPYAQGSGLGGWRPVPTTAETIAAGGIPRLLNVVEARQAIKEHEAEQAASMKRKQAAYGMRMVPLGSYGY